MDLVVNHVYTTAHGDSFEMLELSRILTFRNVDFTLISLLSNENKFYSGLLPFVRKKARGVKLTLNIEDKRTYSEDILSDDKTQELLTYTPYEYQWSATRKAIKLKRGVVQLPTSAGKTLIAAIICVKLGLPTIVFTNSSNILTQTALKYLEYGLDSIGVIGGIDGDDADSLEQQGIVIWDDFDPSPIYDCRIVISTVQSYKSLVFDNPEGFTAFRKSRQVMLMDEVHNSSADTWQICAYMTPAAYRIGFSGTPFRDIDGIDDSVPDVRDMILTGLTGDVIMSLSHNYLVERGFIASPEVYYIPTDIDLPLLSYTWTTVYRRGIEKNKLRNRIIINMLLTLYKKGFKVLVIVGRKEHGRLLLRALAKRKVENVFFSFGGRSVEEWDVENDNAVTSEFSTDELHKHIGALDKAILIGSSTYDEGVDLPSISVCMLVAGGKSLRQSLQRVGRVLRKHGDKKALIIDFADRFHPFLAKHARARRAIFEHVGFPVYDGFPDVLLS